MSLLQTGQKQSSDIVLKHSNIKNNFIESLTNIYKKEFLSDLTLRIIEDTADETDKHNEDNNIERRCNDEVCFPVHKLVLCLNSKFFEKLLHDTSMKEKNEKEITLRVNPGDSKYVELLIHSFYDFDLLNNIGLFKLLKVLEYGDRYMCDALLKQGSLMINHESVETVDECNSVLDRLNFYESSLSHVLKEDFFDNCCSQFLTRTFTPLEFVAFGELQNKLHFSSLLMLLKSNAGFAFHENSVMTFVLNWLEADESRQTEQNIEALLAECRYEHMEVQFLKTVLSHTNPILCKWSGFLSWFIEAITYPSSTILFNQSCKRLNRSLKTENKIQSDPFSKISTTPCFSPGLFAQNIVLKNTAIKTDVLCYEGNVKTEFHKYDLKMEFNEAKKKWTSDRWIMYKGYILQPAIFFGKNKNNVMLEMYLGKEDQERELKNFTLEITFQFGHLAENQKNPASVSHRKMVFLESNRAEISIDDKLKELCYSCYECFLNFNY